jgi:lipoate-protein ligase A
MHYSKAIEENNSLKERLTAIELLCISLQQKMDKMLETFTKIKEPDEEEEEDDENEEDEDEEDEDEEDEIKGNIES